MSDQAAFLRAIRANPDDDTPRLAFADWLDDHDQPARAEFVRVQIELDPIRDQLESPRVMELRAREAELLAAHRAAWLGDAADVESEPPAFGPVFRRGFPELVCLRLDTFLMRGEALFAEHPTLREVAVFDSAGRGSELAACPSLHHVETLEIAEACFTEMPDSSRELCDALDRAGVRRLRIPAVCDPPYTHPHLFHSMAARSFPRDLEAVVLLPLTRTLPAAALANLGPVAGRLVRPAERAFPIDGTRLAFDPDGWGTGRPVRGRQVLAGYSDGRPVVVGVWHVFRREPYFDVAGVSVATFNADGVMTERERYVLSSPRHEENGDSQLGDEVLRTLREKHRFEPGFVRVREFRVGSDLIGRLWPEKMFDDYLFLGNPAQRPAGCEDDDAAWRARGGALRRWLHERKFVVSWSGGEFVFDDAGRLVGT